MIDNNKALNDFEKQTLVNLLTDFDVHFLDEVDDYKTISTMIIVQTIDGSQSHYYWPYILGTEGFSTRRSLENICKKAREDFSNPEKMKDNPFHSFHSKKII